MDVKLIITESNDSKDYVKRLLMNDSNIGNCTYILQYKNYNHNSLYEKFGPETWRFTPNTPNNSQTGNIGVWYVGRGYNKYWGVRIIIDDGEPSEPIISEPMDRTETRIQNLEKFMNEIKNTIDDLSGAGDYIELDDIVL